MKPSASATAAVVAAKGVGASGASRFAFSPIKRTFRLIVDDVDEHVSKVSTFYLLTSLTTSDNESLFLESQRFELRVQRICAVDEPFVFLFSETGLENHRRESETFGWCYWVR